MGPTGKRGKAQKPAECAPAEYPPAAGDRRRRGGEKKFLADCVLSNVFIDSTLVIRLRGGKRLSYCEDVEAWLELEEPREAKGGTDYDLGPTVFVLFRVYLLLLSPRLAEYNSAPIPEERKDCAET